MVAAIGFELSYIVLMPANMLNSTRTSSVTKQQEVSVLFDMRVVEISGFSMLKNEFQRLKLIQNYFAEFENHSKYIDNGIYELYL